MIVVLAAATSRAQDRRVTKPSAGEAEAVRAGTTLFQTRCAECHGIDAKGVRGPDLTAVWAAGRSDAGLFQTIRRGVPGSEMPASSAPDAEIWATLAYLRSLTPTIPDDYSRGEAQNGERLFWASCGGCHRVNGRGGRLGPDLSRIGSSQSRATLVRAIRAASAAIAPGYRPVTLVTRDGQRIRGAAKSEDAFSIQIMDTRERLQGYLKENLRDVAEDAQSLMPDFPASRLGDRDLDDLLRFLSTLRGGDPGGR